MIHSPLFDKRPIKSSSCQRVWITIIALPLPLALVATLSAKVSYTLSRKSWLFASSPFLNGSSTITSAPPLLVRPPRIPVANIPPWCLSMSHNVFLSWLSLISTPKISLPKFLISCLFLLPNFSATSALYAVTITLKSGFLPINQDGKVSVTVIDLPCCGGTLIQIFTFWPFSTFSTTLWQILQINAWNFVNI